MYYYIEKRDSVVLFSFNHRRNSDTRQMLENTPAAKYIFPKIERQIDILTLIFLRKFYKEKLDSNISLSCVKLSQK